MPEWIGEVAAGSARSYAIELIRYLAAAGVATGLLWVGAGWATRHRIQPRIPAAAELRHEFVSSLITIGAFTVAMTATILLIRADAINVLMTHPPLWLALVEFGAMVVAHDAYFYWIHRGLHDRRLFRRLHMTHHKSRSPTAWAAYSFAPVEGFLHAAFVPLFLLCVPAFHGFVVMAMLLYEIIRNVIGHSGHEFAWSGFTRSRWTRWITTTTHHDLHHSQGACNYGLYFTWWDRWMGTEYPQYHDAFEAVVRKAAAQNLANPGAR